MKGKKSGLCRWGCGRKADNRSGICDDCWNRRAELAKLRAQMEAGKPKRGMSEAQKESMKAAHKARFDAKMASQATNGRIGLLVRRART